ncbi:hypothetical protein FQZ97_921850 [compost metagenome]
MPSVTTMGGSENRMISQPLTAPSSAPTTQAMSSSAGSGMPGQARAASAQSMPVSARLDATERSTPRVSSTSIWPMTRITRMAESLPMSSTLRQLRNTGARQPTASTMSTMMAASSHSRRRV